MQCTTDGSTTKMWASYRLQQPWFYPFTSFLLNLLFQLKGEAVCLADAVAPPDAILNSPLGSSDGQVKTVERSHS